MIELRSSDDMDFRSSLDAALRGRTYAMIFLEGGRGVNLDGCQVTLRSNHLIAVSKAASALYLVPYDQIVSVEVNTAS
jgi:hypothetical protein